MAIPFYNQADQDIYAGGEHFIPQERFRLNYTPSTALASTIGNTGGVTQTQAASPYMWPPQGGGGGFGGGNTNQLIKDFYGATANRQKRLENPNWLGTQLNKFLPQQRSVKDMVTPPTGNYSRSIADTKNFGLDVLPGQGQYGEMPGVIEGDVRMLGGLPFGIGSMISKIMPDKYYDMDPGNQAYIQSQMGYSGPTVFGENTMANKDPFGVNVRSAFGDYGAYTDKMADPEGALAALVAQQEEEGKTNTIQMRKLNFYKNLARKKSIINRNVATQRKMRDAWEAETGREMDAADRAFADTGDYDEYSGAGGTPNYTIPAGTYSYEGSDEQDKANEGASNTGGSTSGGSYSRPGSEGAPGHHWAKGGRIGYERGRVVRPGGYAGMTMFEAWVKDQYGVNVKDINDWNFYAGLANEWQRLGGSKAEGGRIGYETAGPVLGDDEGSENIFEIMQDQGVPHSEMVSEPHPLDALNDFSWEIFNKPYDALDDEERGILHDLATDQVMGEQDQGIASLV